MNKLTKLLPQPPQLIDSGVLTKDFSKFTGNLSYVLSLCTTIALAWGYYLTHTIISIDCLSADRYYNGLLIAQNRVTATIANKLLNLESNNFYFSNLLGILLLATGIIVLCVIISNLSGIQSTFPYIVFSCIYISFPLFFEYFNFAGGTLAVGGSTLLMSLALYFLASGKKVISSLLIPCVLIVFAMSWYEAFAFMFVAMTAFFLILALKNNLRTQKEIFLYGINFAIVLIVGTIAKLLLGILLMNILNIDHNYNADTSSFWFAGGSIRSLVGTIFTDWISKIFCYAPFTVIAIAIFTGLCLMSYDIIKYKKPLFLLLYAVLFLSIFAYTLYRNANIPYRIEQGFPPFAASIFFLLSIKVSASKPNFAIYITNILIVCVVILQCVSANYWTTLEYDRYTEEKQTALNISTTLHNNQYDLSKPVVIIGNYSLSENIETKAKIKEGSLAEKIYLLGMKIDSDNIIQSRNNRKCDTNVRSYLQWGVTAFSEPGTEIYKFFQYVNAGDFVQANIEQYSNACKKYKNSPSYPDNGYIIENDEYIVVKLGDIDTNPS